MKNKSTDKKRIIEIIILILLPFAAAFAALGIGRILLSPKDIADAIIALFDGHEIPVLTYTTFWKLRLPRIILAAVVGAGLSVSGCTFQSVFANPLATPDTLGVASGASFGAALGILFNFDLIGTQLMSLLFGLIAVALTWAAGTSRENTMNTVVLSGIMIGSLFSALLSLTKFVADTETQLPAITYWLMGSMKSVGTSTLLCGLPPIIISILVLFLIRWKMNLLPMTDDEIRSCGENPTVLRITSIICASVIAASCVSMCGQVGWIGLLVPHMCRMKFGSNHKSLIPAVISIGAVFMIVTDTIARSVSASEIPVSVLTAIIGAPFFILLMRKSGGFGR